MTTNSNEDTTTIANSRSSSLPYWLVNVPREEWPDKCPEYLRNLDERDREILGTPDAEYKRMSWEEIDELVS